MGTHYIPHHAVEKDSPTTPIRIVFDCSCRQSSNHPSLNDCLEIGTPCSNDLCSILVRFRLHQFGISADIKKAFLNIQLYLDDRDYTRFFWLLEPRDPSSQFCVYRFKVIPFGATSSPFILNAVLQHHLEKHDTAISRDMQLNFYVDNIITGYDTESAAVDYYKTARAIMSSAKFNLRSWSSNSNELMAKAVQDSTADDHNIVNVLGLHWNPTTDVLSVVTKPFLPACNHLVTKTEVLQVTSRIFDPLGFVSPVVIRAKIFLQTLWKHKVGWDEPLTDNLTKDWLDIAADLQQSSDIFIKRCYFPAHPTQPVIHCFADASQKAYGAIVFITDKEQTSFVLAKTRVAPLKQLTLPRLELMAALIATRLTQFVVTHIPLQNPPIFIWSDSQIVLHWVNSTKQLPTFVRNRVSEMKTNLPDANWRYCPTLANPANLLSRGTTTQQLMSSKLWQHGPEWLTTPSLWPLCEQPSPLLVAAVTASEFVPEVPPEPNVGIHCVVFINRHSTLNKLLTVTAYVLHFVRNLRTSPETRQIGPVCAEELLSAKLKWIKDTQQTVYRAEIANLHQIANHSNTSRITLVRQLRLFLDSKGYLRCGGRIHNAPVNEATKFPYLLPSKHLLSSLTVLDIHTTLCHSGTGATLTALRQSYWIPTG